MNLLVALVTALPLAHAQTPEPALPRVGDRAPALQYDHLLGAAGKAAELATAGKVVVLDFSTSWCAGCRASVPHWNALAAELSAEPIVFLSVTNEELAAAERFVKDVGLRTPLAVDLDGSLFEAFAVNGVPDAVVIGADGRIAGYSHPAKLDAETLRQVVAGKPVTFTGGLPRAARSWNHTQALSANEVQSGSFVVRPCSKPSGMIKQDPKTGVIFAGGVTLRALLTTVLDCDAGDLELDPALPKDVLYELRARGTDDTLASTRAFARERLAKELGIEVKTAMVEGKALILKRIDGHGGPPAADVSRKGGTMRNGAVQFGSVTADKLAAALRRNTTVPVVDETGLSDPFAVDLQWDPQRGLDGLREALATIGLRFEDGVRPTPKHRVTPRA
ncbi:MAG TPA: redoxin domain-containing protein [Planctomycetota bacterium]|nr:redoxin domain-containing protein [Planctomycetota bacterium]